MRYFLYIIVSLCTTNIGWGQYGNEWINYGSNHWTFPVAQDGLYRITYEQLVQSGVPTDNWTPEQLQLVANGQTITWDFVGDLDDEFEPEEYYQAYLRGNSSASEQGAYPDENWRANDDYSLFNDTIKHYITNSGLGEITALPGIPADVNVPQHMSVKYRLHHALNSNYYLGRSDNNGVSLPSYDEGEGWYDPSFGTSVYTVSMPLESRDIAWENVQLSWRVASVNSALGIPNHHLLVEGPNGQGVLFDTTFTGYQLIRKTMDMQVPANQSQVSIDFRTVNDLGVLSDRMALGMLDITYKRLPVFGSGQTAMFEVEAIPGAQWTRVELQLSAYQSPAVFIYANGLRTRLPLINSDGITTVFIPWISESHHTLLLVDSALSMPSSEMPIQPIELVNYREMCEDGELIILTHRSLWNAAQNYATYKSSNGHSVLLVDVDQLYHQYGGVAKSPIAIRRFFADLFAAGIEPSHLFIIGKSIHEASLGSTSSARKDQELYGNNLVPTWGYPGSDAMFTAGLNGTTYEPAIPTGRLSAENQDDVLNYLNKVVEHTSQPAAMWKKNVLHFGGGSIAFEQDLFKNYLNTYKSTAQGLHLGADVHSFFKDTNEPIQLNVSDSIQYFINEGVSVMTFFGHASSTGFDQNIDAPENYTNQGKYPLLIGNSCYTGNIHLSSSQSASELFVKAPNRGVIGFLAKSDLGIPTYLDMFTENFYLNLFQFNYGSSIGQCMQSAIQAFQTEGDFYKQNVAQNFTLHGDPSVVLFPHEKPDLVVENTSIILPAGPVSAAEPTLRIKTVVENWGKATTEEIEVALTHHMPNGVDTTYIATLNQSLRRDTLTWEVSNQGQLGQHQFGLAVDYPGNAIDELENIENNTTDRVSLQVTDGDIRPIYPYDYAVVDEAQPVLKASTAYAMEGLRTYRIQADTNASFQSPFLLETTITTSGGIVEWQLPVNLADSAVVFWRCSPDSLLAEDQWYWKSASFQYIINRRGWGQQHPDQFVTNALVGMDFENGQWQFETTSAQLQCEVYGAAATYFENLATRYQLDLDVQDYGGYGYSLPALMVAVLDSASLVPWKSNYAGLAPENEFGNTLASANARSRQEKYFIFQQNSTDQLEGLAQMLETGIPAGNHVLMYTWQYALPSAWPSSLTQALNARGLLDITSLPDSLPFIGYWKQGNLSTLQMSIGSSSDAFLEMNIDLVGIAGQGRMKSPVIGPAIDWDEAEWLLGSENYGISDELVWTLEAGQTMPNSTYLADANNWVQPGILLNQLNNGIAPLAQWELEWTDASAGSLVPLRHLHIWYTEAPEFALAANAESYFSADTVAQGQPYIFMMPIRNVGQIDGDSLLVNYVVVDEKGQVHKLPYIRQEPLMVGQEIRDTIHISTLHIPGWNRLIMLVNPLDSMSQLADQLEQHRFNNQLEHRFYVQRDVASPILEVSADGRHLLDGEIISARPSLLVTLRDENRYLLFNDWADTTHFRIYLTKPNGEIDLVRFDQSEVSIQFSNGPREPFSILYKPEELKDGIYLLRVQANDKSGNQSGELDYQIHFKVVNQASISEMMNYPNPFSTSTRFVFTLTGSEIPEDIKIQIMSMSGKVVREIMGHELGTLHIGRNITDFAWDGRDEYGDLLANGVYVYRTVVRMHGQDMLHLESESDAYFNKGFGKMYLMR